MNNQEKIYEAIKPFLGHKVSHVSPGFAGWIFLEFGNIHTTTKITRSGKTLRSDKGDQSLTICRDWQFQKGEATLVTWEHTTDDDIRGCLPLFENRIFEGIIVDELSLDTTMRFDEQISLYITNSGSEEGHAWNMRFENNDYFSIGPGNQISLEHSKKK